LKQRTIKRLSVNRVDRYGSYRRLTIVGSKLVSMDAVIQWTQHALLRKDGIKCMREARSIGNRMSGA